jgi:beta-galactosidase
MVFALPAAETSASRTENFNRDWKFALGKQEGAEKPDFNDSAWATVRLPHDWAIAGPYDPQGDPHTGKLPWRGEGWYRKSFTLPAADAGKRVYLDFDGVMAMPTVYVNGRKAGDWDYGYTSFRVDATDFVRFGEPNLVAVRVDTRTHTSRWYPGAGIYRKVQLSVDHPVHLAHWGTVITTPTVTDTTAQVRVCTTVENRGANTAETWLEIGLVDPRGKQIPGNRRVFAIPTGASHEFETVLTVLGPERWDVSSPNLYKAISRLTVAGKLVDTAETPFGIRTFEFTAKDGFHLNGKRVQLYGVNLHHDQGPLGAAFSRRAMERQLEIMKDMGVNAIRTSHNPPAPEMLDLCDRMGFVVWDELFDKWDQTSTRPQWMSILEYGKKQVDAFVRRDRNHPSVVVWSAGNEVWDLEGGQLPDSPGLLRQMVGYFKALDPTRPVTLAHAIPESAKTPLDDSLDVAGWNYARRYRISLETRPNLPIIYSESASAYSTRGYYDFPHPTAKDDYPDSLQISSYDHNSASYGDIPDTEFALMQQDAFVAGEFVWTGFDYLGEPVPFVSEGWGSFKKRKIKKEEEARSSSFGIVDLVGLPKDRFYLYRSHWAPRKNTLHILPHWNWPDRVGANVPIYVYTNGDAAEVFVNGKSLGERVKNPKAENVMDRYRLRWEDAIYEPGEVKAVAYSRGRIIAQAIVRTAGDPAQLRLTPDRTALRSDGDDLCYVVVEALDKDGTLCPLAANQVKFKVTGPAAIAGVGNGDPHFPQEFDTDTLPLFYGKAVLIVRADEGAGASITIEAESAGLQSGTAAITSAP